MGRLIPITVHKDVHEIPETLLTRCRFFQREMSSIDTYLNALRNYNFVVDNLVLLPEMSTIQLAQWTFTEEKILVKLIVPVRSRFYVYKFDKCIQDCTKEDALEKISDEICILDIQDKTLYHFPNYRTYEI